MSTLNDAIAREAAGLRAELRELRAFMASTSRGLDPSGNRSARDVAGWMEDLQSTGKGDGSDYYKRAYRNAKKEQAASNKRIRANLGLEPVTKTVNMPPRTATMSTFTAAKQTTRGREIMTELGRFANITTDQADELQSHRTALMAAQIDRDGMEAEAARQRRASMPAAASWAGPAPTATRFVQQDRVAQTFNARRVDPADLRPLGWQIGYGAGRKA